MLAGICVFVIFLYAMIGNCLDYRVWPHYKNPNRRIGKWDLWLHPEQFTEEGQRLRRIAGRYYFVGALMLAGAFLLLRFVTEQVRERAPAFVPADHRSIVHLSAGVSCYGIEVMHAAWLAVFGSSLGLLALWRGGRQWLPVSAHIARNVIEFMMMLLSL